MSKIKNIVNFGMLIALYVVLSEAFHIPLPLAGNKWFDLGYIVFGVAIVLYGNYGIIVGVLGVLIENILFSGFISISWMVGQVIIGIFCSYAFTKCEKVPITIIIACLSCFIGIGVVKTLIEVSLGYGIFEVKFISNTITSFADCVPLLIGYFVSKKMKKSFTII